MLECSDEGFNYLLEEDIFMEIINIMNNNNISDEEISLIVNIFTTFQKQREKLFKFMEIEKENLKKIKKNELKKEDLKSNTEEISENLNVKINFLNKYNFISSKINGLIPFFFEIWNKREE